MSAMILMNDYRVLLLAPRGLPEDKYEAMRLALSDERLRAELRRAALVVVRRRRALDRVRVRVSL